MTNAGNPWWQVSPYLDELLELDPSAQDSWLANMEKAQPEIARELRELLKLHVAVRGSGFLERSILSSDDSLLIGKKIGAYTIERLLGRGGMGSVWLGRRSDDKFEGKAAVKLLERRGLGQLAATQIRHEANLLARLSHAHIARLFDAGVREDGQPYLVLEYIEGEPIDEYCQTHALTLTKRLLLFLDVLDAVAYAQGQLIVHGDLKPSNVLVTEDGSAKLVDFGVATLRSDTFATPIESSEAAPKALTPGYAPPEQVRGETLSAAADVYSLGVLLHVLVTGQHPFSASASTRTQLVRAAMTEDPPSASTQVVDAIEQRRVRGDLDAIIARALERDPVHRYPMAADLAADIRRFLGNFPVTAQRSTRRYVVRKFSQRHWGGVLGAFLTLAFLICAVAITTSQMIEARHQRDFARRQLARAESSNELMSYVLTDAAPGGKPFTVNELLARAAHVLDRQRTDDADRASLLTSIGRQYQTQDEDNAAVKYLGDAYQISRGVADPSVRARAACAFASTLAEHDNSARSEALLVEGLSELPDNAEFALDRSFCWMNGSRIAMAHGATPLAIERTQTAIRALGDVPFDHELADLRAGADLAEAYRDAGRYREAVATFEQLWPRLVAQGRDDTATAGTWLNNWGMALEQMGRPLEAEKLLRQSIKIHRADASDDALSPMLMTNYAGLLLDLHRLPEAQDYAQKALDSATRAGDDIVINQTLLRLARIYRAQHDFPRSLAMLNEVEPRLHSALPPGHYAFAGLASERSQTLELEGDTVRALNLANLAISMCEEASRQGKKCVQYLPKMFRLRASIETGLKQFAQAETDARQALALLQQQDQPGEFSQSTGLTYLTLARCLTAQGKDAEGRAMAQLAADHLERSIGLDHPDTRMARELAMGP
jgi:eukaryotic-like serine/threonine-protein kinase